MTDLPGPIYLDANATTPLLPAVAEAMARCQRETCGNPASQHQFGRRARLALEEAREGIGQLLGARLSGRRPDRVIFTSGGTEANNLALLGAADSAAPAAACPRLIVSNIEHPSVSRCATALANRGWSIDTLPVGADGVACVDALDELLTKDTRLVTLQLASNETGVVQPVKEIAHRCTSAGLFVHTDAVQMAGKLPLNFAELGVASLSVAAHKVHGPIGIGALLVRGDAELTPRLYGGFQQDGVRPGTEAVALAVGMYTALAAWQREAEARRARLAALRDHFEATLTAGYDGKLVINGATAPRLPQTSNVSFVGLDRQALLMAMDLAGIACSTGSACASGSSEPSATLIAMGCPANVLNSSLRFSLSAMTTQAEIEAAIERILSVSNRMLHGR